MSCRSLGTKAWRRLQHAGVVLTLLEALGMGVAHAQPCEAKNCQTPQPARQVVHVSLVGQDLDHPAFRALLEEWLAPDYALHLHSAQHFRLSEALNVQARDNSLHVWITLTGVNPDNQPRAARLYFALAQADRFLSRDVALRSGMDELGRERVAQVLQSSVSALLDGLLGVSRKEAETRFEPPESAAPPVPQEPRPKKKPPPPESPKPTPRTTPPPAPQRATARWRGGIHYSVAWRGAEQTGHGVGALLSLGMQRALWWGFTATGYHQFARQLSADDVTLALSNTAFRLGAAVASPSTKAGFTWELGVASGLDWLHAQPSATRPDVTASGSQTDFRPVVAPFGGLGHVISGMHLQLSAHLDTQLFDSHFDVIDAAGDRQRVFSADLVQPRLQLAVGLW